MANVIVNDVQPYIQYVAAGGDTIFVFPYVVFVDSDLKVLLVPVGDKPSDTAAILQLGIDYVVEGLGQSGGGKIILTKPATTGDFITILRDSPIQRLSNFAPGNFSEEQMNDALDGQVTYSQDNEMFRNKLTPQYPKAGFYLPGELVLPKLAADEIWKMNPTASGLIAVKFSQTNCDTLRQDLAVETQFSDGARLVGYFDKRVGGLGQTTVNLALDEAYKIVQPVSATNNIILGGAFSVNPFQEGISFSDTDIGLARYVADGWIIEIAVGGIMRASTLRDSSLPVPIALSNIFSQDSMQITSAIAQPVLQVNDRCVFIQPIEGYYFQEIAQRDFAMSFYVRSSLPGIYCVAFVSSDQTQSFIKEYTINGANVWEKKVINVPPSPSTPSWGNYREEAAISCTFTLAAGANSQNTQGSWISGGNFVATLNQVNFFENVGNTFNVDLIQVEPVKDTPFQLRSQQEEIAFAQRYFEKSYNIGVIPGTITLVGRHISIIAVANQSSHEGFQSTFAVKKRITPAVTWFSPNTGQINKVELEGVGDVDAAASEPGEGSTGSVGTVPIVGISETLRGHFTADARIF